MRILFVVTEAAEKLLEGKTSKLRYMLHCFLQFFCMSAKMAQTVTHNNCVKDQINKCAFGLDDM